ncbi:MAG TPA: cytochrome C oxidase subunit IV family protein [Sphingobacteriaceae bacterium]|nr:cytochrome C oxidase subunit IV family protein [Sphingobacteriaceae bacterium]
MAEATQTHDEHAKVQQEYIRTGIWLLVLMVLKVGVVSVEMPRTLMVATLLVLMLLKLWLITGVFMHLKYEKMTMVLFTAVPVIFAIILFFGILPDFTISPWLP